MRVSTQNIRRCLLLNHAIILSKATLCTRTGRGFLGSHIRLQSFTLPSTKGLTGDAVGWRTWGIMHALCQWAMLLPQSSPIPANGAYTNIGNDFQLRQNPHKVFFRHYRRTSLWSKCHILKTSPPSSCLSGDFILQQQYVYSMCAYQHFPLFNWRLQRLKARLSACKAGALPQT